MHNIEHGQLKKKKGEGRKKQLKYWNREKRERVEDKKAWERLHLAKAKGQAKKKKRSQSQKTHKTYNSSSCLGKTGGKLTHCPAVI